MQGIYIHIPFCRKKCAYCDFPSYGGMEQQQDAYTTALCREIEGFCGEDRNVDTVYLGGGTPSLLSPEQIKKILRTVRNCFSIARNAEITLEANPDSMSRELAEAFPACGINRVSLGVQSFDPLLLQQLGRLHTPQQARDAVAALKQAGIRNISIDLMYGLPGQSIEAVRRDMEELHNLSVQHASVYSLILEEHTMLWRDVEKGIVVLPEEDIIDAMGKMVHGLMHQYGFSHYEISSYCQHGFMSRHNSKYWRYEPYIGFGVSAHSFSGEARWANISNIPEYIKKAGYESVMGDHLTLTRKRAVEDYCFLALRLRSGINYEQFQQRFGRAIEEEFGSVLQRLLKQGFLQKTEHGCSLSETGLAYGNYVFEQFIRE